MPEPPVHVPELAFEPPVHVHAGPWVTEDVADDVSPDTHARIPREAAARSSHIGESHHHHNHHTRTHTPAVHKIIENENRHHDQHAHMHTPSVHAIIELEKHEALHKIAQPELDQEFEPDFEAKDGTEGDDKGDVESGLEVGDERGGQSESPMELGPSWSEPPSVLRI